MNLLSYPGQRYTKWVKALLPWLVVLALGYPVFLLREGDVGSDAFSYMSLALRMNRGMGYIVPPENPLYPITSTRAPMFPSMISVPFWLMGPSVAHALLVTKVAFLLSLALLYLLGKKLYGKQVGLASVVLAVSSFYMMKLPTHLYIDHVQTLFMLLSLYVFIQAIERGRHGLSILAGVSLGIGFLCKELAILWLPLPLLLVLGIAEWRTWKSLRLVIAFWLGFFLPVACWWFYYYVVTGDVFLMSNAVWGVGYKILTPLAISVTAMLIAAGCGYLIYTRSTERSIPGADLFRRVKSYPLSLVGGLGWLIWLVFTVAFLIILSRATGWISSPSEIPIRFSSFVDLWYNARVVPDQPLLRYVVVALVPVLVGAFLRKQKSDRILIWSLLTCVPLMLTANPGRYFPSRYLLPVFWLAYLALGRLLILIISFVAMVLRWSRSKDNLFVHSFQNTLLLILIVFGTWKSYTIISTEEYVSSTSSGAYNDQSVIEVGRWLSEHAPPGSNIGSTLHYLTGLYFYTGGQYEFYQFWRRSLDIEQVWPYNTKGTYLANQGDRTTFVYLNQPDVTISDPLYVQYAGEKKFRQGAYDAGLVYFSGLSQQRLVDYLQRFSIDYLTLAVGKHPYMMGVLPDYFFDHPAFTQVFTTTLGRRGDVVTLYIFGVDHALLTYEDYPVVLDTDTLGVLITQVQQLDPGHEDHERRLLQALNYRPILLRPRSLTDVDYYSRIAEIYAHYDEIDTAALQYHIALSETQNQADVFSGIAEQLTVEYPDFVGSWLLLGDVYRYHRQIDLAYAAYQQALSAPIGTQETRAAVHRGLSWVYSLDGNDAQVIEESERSLELSLFDAHEIRQQILIAQGNLYQANGDIDRAIIAYQQARHTVPDRQGQAVPDSFDPLSYDFVHQLDSAEVSTKEELSVRSAVFIIDDQPRLVLFAHPPSQISYSIHIPANAMLRFAPVMAHEVWRLGKGDGVQFKVDLMETHSRTPYLLYSKYIDPKNITTDRVWFEQEIDLSPWAGQTVTITFSTGCGPNDDCRYDWAGWGEPRIVQPIVYNFLEQYPTAQVIETDPGNVYTETLTINYESRDIIFQHPTSRLIYSLDLPKQSSLAFGFSMSPEVWSPDKGDGVEYNIYVRRQDEPYKLYWVFQKYIDPKNNLEDRRWFDERLDLSRFGGQTVEIIFETRPGPAGDANYDWGGWSTPVLIDETLQSQNGATPVYSRPAEP